MCHTYAEASQEAQPGELWNYWTHSGILKQAAVVANFFLKVCHSATIYLLCSTSENLSESRSPVQPKTYQTSSPHVSKAPYHRYVCFSDILSCAAAQGQIWCYRVYRERGKVWLFHCLLCEEKVLSLFSKGPSIFQLFHPYVKCNPVSRNYNYNCPLKAECL